METQFKHFKLIDGRSGMTMGFTLKVKNGEDATAKLVVLKEKASMKKNCPIQMIEVISYTPYKKRVR